MNAMKGDQAPSSHLFLSTPNVKWRWKATSILSTKDSVRNLSFQLEDRTLSIVVICRARQGGHRLSESSMSRPAYDSIAVLFEWSPRGMEEILQLNFPVLVVRVRPRPYPGVADFAFASTTNFHSAQCHNVTTVALSNIIQATCATF